MIAWLQQCGEALAACLEVPLGAFVLIEIANWRDVHGKPLRTVKRGQR